MRKIIHTFRSWPRYAYVEKRTFLFITWYQLCLVNYDQRDDAILSNDTSLHFSLDFAVKLAKIFVAKADPHDRMFTR